MSSKKVLLELDPNETIIVELKRHPISAFGIIASTAIAIAVCLTLLFLAVKNSDTLSFGLGSGTYGLIFGGLSLLIAVFGYIAIIVDRSNELVVTDENIIQILQYSLFSNQTSQLNLAKIQDVSVDTMGIFPSLFNYGTLDIETAGEASNFKFRFAPNPNQVAKQIIEAHEAYIAKHHPGAHDPLQQN